MGKILLVENINSNYYYVIPVKASGVFPGTKCVAQDEVTTYSSRPSGTVYKYQGPSGSSYSKMAVILNYFVNAPAETIYTYSCTFQFRNNTGQSSGVVIPYTCYGKSSTCMMTASNGGNTSVTISFTSNTSLSSSNLGITFQQPYLSTNSSRKFKIGSTTSSTTTTYSISNCFKTSGASTQYVYINR